MRKEYHKLGRDRIPEIIEGEGKAFEVRVLDEAAYREALRKVVNDGCAAFGFSSEWPCPPFGENDCESEKDGPNRR